MRSRRPEARRGLDPATISRLLDRRVEINPGEDYFASVPEDMAHYLRHASGRMAVCLEMARSALTTPGAAVLELGADPWFFTQLLAEAGSAPAVAAKRGGIWQERVTCESPVPVRIAWGGREIVVDQHLFDVERDVFPFPDGAFDLVVCMEVIEHLSVSPAHLLHEVNRILRPEGHLLIACPNALAVRKTVAMVKGRNPAPRYSGYGAMGRHNREPSAAELALMLAEANLSAPVEVQDVAGYEPGDRLSRLLRPLIGTVAPARRDHLFALAEKTGPPRYGLPASLYQAFDADRMREEGLLAPEA